jgi:copper chaperone CopZ
VRSALKPLPGVEPSSIDADLTTKEVTFNVADKSKYDEEAVKKAITDAGYTVEEVKASPKK